MTRCMSVHLRETGTVFTTRDTCTYSWITVKPLMLASIIVSVFYKSDILASTKVSISCYYTMHIASTKVSDY